MLLVDSATPRVVDGNPALVRSGAIALAELCAMPIGAILGTADGHGSDSLTTQLSEPPSRLLVEAAQRWRSGRQLYVEISGHRLELAGRSLFALSTRDVTRRRKVQAQQLERQQYLNHFPHYDQPPRTGEAALSRGESAQGH